MLLIYIIILFLPQILERLMDFAPILFMLIFIWELGGGLGRRGLLVSIFDNGID